MKMRRKSTRNAQKSTPDKPPKETETPPKTRRSRRRKRSPSKSSDSEEEVLTVTKRSAPAETPDTTTKSHTPTDEDNSEEPMWKVTSTEENPKGKEIQKLKISLTRPSPDSPEKSKPRRSKSNSQTEDETTSSEDKSARKTRSQGSPLVRTDGLSSQEGEEELEDKKGKGKSKGKHKSKIEKSPHLSEPELQTNNEISENVQVTPQSPSIDKPVDNENDHKVDVDDLQNVNETVQGHENVEESASNVGRDSDNERDKVDVSKTKSKSCGNTENKMSDDDEPLSVVQKIENYKKCDESDSKNENQDIQSDSKDQHQDVKLDSNDEHRDVDIDNKTQHQNLESENKNEHQDVESASENKHQDVESATKNDQDVESATKNEQQDVESASRSEHRDVESVTKNEHQDVESATKNDQDVESATKDDHQDIVSKDQQESPEISHEETLQQCEVNVEPSEDTKVIEEEPVEPEKQVVLEETAISSPKESEVKDTEDRSTDENVPKSSTELVTHEKDKEEKIQQELPTENTRTNQSDTIEPERKVRGKSGEKSSPSAAEEKQRRKRERAPRHRLKRNIESIQADSKEKEQNDEICRIKPSQIKRKWEGDPSLKQSLIKIDLESIQTVWPTIDFPEEPDLHLEVEKERRKSHTESSSIKLERKVSVEYKSEFSERPSFEKQSSVNSVTKDGEDSSNIIAFNRKISIVDDTASKLKPPPSPAKNAISNILYITNLVRPFTVKQLKELLERTGKIQEEGFWTDRIKSKCYVQYETPEEAEATRNALHGVQWPIGNGKKLIIDYATEEDMQNAKNPPPPPAPAPVPETKAATKENLEPMENKPRTEEKSSKDLEKKRAEPPVREWDIGKKELRRDRSRSRERSRKHRRSPSPSDDFISRKQRKAEESVPQKLMDDLFLKTKATPSIYWQPLSPEEISMKQQQRLIRMEEHKRRMEENSRMKGREMGRGAFRRRYD